MISVFSYFEYQHRIESDYFSYLKCILILRCLIMILGCRVRLSNLHMHHAVCKFIHSSYLTIIVTFSLFQSGF